MKATSNGLHIWPTLSEWLAGPQFPSLNSLGLVLVEFRRVLVKNRLVRQFYLHQIPNRL